MIGKNSVSSRLSASVSGGRARVGKKLKKYQEGGMSRGNTARKSFTRVL